MNIAGKKYARWRTIILHIAVWSGIFSLIFFMESLSLRPDMGARRTFFITFRSLSVLVLALVFYFNAYYLLPRTKSAKQWGVFIFLQLLLLFVYVLSVDVVFEKLMGDQLFGPFQPRMNGASLGKWQAMPLIPRRKPMPFNWITVLPYTLSVTASLAFYYIKESLKLDKQRKELQVVSLTSELQFLKSQVSPHFLFNVLNSLTFLARKQSTILEPSLIKLSSLLRYMLYETNVPKTLLDKEIGYLKDYIELQQLRYHDIHITTSFRNHYEQAVIAPMLLVPFVENAFKHTALIDTVHSFIRITLTTEKDQLYFMVTNSYDAATKVHTDEASGIGLVNVIKRLEILYPGQHDLQIQKGDDQFDIVLNIKLQADHETELYSD